MYIGVGIVVDVEFDEAIDVVIWYDLLGEEQETGLLEVVFEELGVWGYFWMDPAGVEDCLWFW